MSIPGRDDMTQYHISIHQEEIDALPEGEYLTLALFWDVEERKPCNRLYRDIVKLRKGNRDGLKATMEALCAKGLLKERRNPVLDMKQYSPTDEGAKLVPDMVVLLSYNQALQEHLPQAAALSGFDIQVLNVIYKLQCDYEEEMGMPMHIGCNYREVAEHLGDIHPRKVVQPLRFLADKGLLRVLYSPENKRAHYKLTEAGFLVLGTHAP